MRAYVVVGTAVGVALMAGCQQKPVALDESQELMSMKSLSALNSTTIIPSSPAVQSKSKEVDPVVAAQLDPLPPAGPYKPSGYEIQTALKNAGYYNGTVDGKVGPMTKEAVEEFQKANSLEADGKVGPKTWVLLGKHAGKSQPVQE